MDNTYNPKIAFSNPTDFPSTPISPSEGRPLTVCKSRGYDLVTGPLQVYPLSVDINKEESAESVPMDALENEESEYSSEPKSASQPMQMLNNQWTASSKMPVNK